MPSVPWSDASGALTRGVTLIELMVGLALAAILAALSAPAFLRQINASRLDAASSELMGTLARARGEAVRLGVRVTVCRSSDASTCASATPPRWELGWITFQDTNANGVRDPGEPLIHAAPALAAQLVAVGNLPVSDRVSFRPSGTTAANGTLRVCNGSAALPDDLRAHDLVVIRTGRVVLERASNVPARCPAP